MEGRENRVQKSKKPSEAGLCASCKSVVASTWIEPDPQSMTALFGVGSSLAAVYQTAGCL